MNGEKFHKYISLKLKELENFSGTGSEKRRGGNEGVLRDIVENKRRKNVRFLPFHDVIEKE
jgi:hypothetical protein